MATSTFKPTRFANQKVAFATEVKIPILPKILNTTGRAAFVPNEVARCKPGSQVSFGDFEAKVSAFFPRLYSTYKCWCLHTCIAALKLISSPEMLH